MAEKTQTLKQVATRFSKETYLYWYELMQLIRQFELMPGLNDDPSFIRALAGLVLGEAVLLGANTAQIARS